MTTTLSTPTTTPKTGPLAPLTPQLSLGPLYPAPRRGLRNLGSLAIGAAVFLLLIAAPAALCYLYSVLPALPHRPL